MPPRAIGTPLDARLWMTIAAAGALLFARRILQGIGIAIGLLTTLLGLALSAFLIAHSLARPASSADLDGTFLIACLLGVAAGGLVLSWVCGRALSELGPHQKPA